MSVLSAQIDYENRKVYILEEILGKPEEKENNTPALARKVRLKLYRDKHIGGVDVTGDPSGLQRSTTNEDGSTTIPSSRTLSAEESCDRR